MGPDSIKVGISFNQSFPKFISLLTILAAKNSPVLIFSTIKVKYGSDYYCFIIN